MAFDQTTRNRLQKFVSDARRVLTEEFTRQLQNEYGLDPVAATETPLERLPNLDDTRRVTAKILRDTLEHYRKTNPTEDTQAILERIVREHAFTVLNRLAALRMAEARGLLIESLAAGYNSKGFQLYARLAGTGLGERGDAYRCYLFSLFDEFALDLRVLFDRFAPTGRLFPREAALLEVLVLMNDTEVAPLWGGDETIGWIYQYFNSKEERKKMRDESAAPRNSRELAVRNQFFTPRYVVEFLTDNTLGRIWYEMTRGEMRLKDQCRYLVRRPTEFFLKPGEEPPASDESAEQNLSQEELLRQPVYISHRPLKDPREIRVLDPACGSMHFGLYAFDLLEVIYEEAWDLEAAGVAPPIERSSELKPLRETYTDKQAFLRDVPRLIIEHNLHGIDIDPRAVQIAGLSLWLRAQRAWQRQGLKPAERPQVRRSNIVCAEPMPGEESLLNEFIERHLSATPELRLVAQLVRRVFRAMKLAGEAGSLLKIEEEVAGAVAEAKAHWLAEAKQEQGQASLFAHLANHEQQRLDFEVAEITDETFWERAEESIYAALREYAEHAENGGGYQRRLFAEDAARGFAFIDICRNMYDVILMNPPFGDVSLNARDYVGAFYSDSKSDLGMVFVECFGKKLLVRGLLGAITNRVFMANETLEIWRDDYLLGGISALSCLLDLGYGILDDAKVEAAAFVIDRDASNSSQVTFLRVLDAREKEAAANDLLTCHQSQRGGFIFNHTLSSFQILPGHVLAYQLPLSISRRIMQGMSLTSLGGNAVVGLQTSDDFRFVRLAWEVPSCSIGRRDNWCYFAKGGEYQPYWDDIHLVVRWAKDGAEIRNFFDTKGKLQSRPQNVQYYFKAGVTWPQRTTSDLSPRVLPEGCVFSVIGQGIFCGTRNRDLAYISGGYSRQFKLIVDAVYGSGDASSPGSMANQYRCGVLADLPPPLWHEADEVGEIALQLVRDGISFFDKDETSRYFSSPFARIQSLNHQVIEGIKETSARVSRTTANHASIEAKVFGELAFDTSDQTMIDMLIGPHPVTYRDTIHPEDIQAIAELWQLSESGLIKAATSKHNARRQLTMKSYIANRRYELVSHTLQISAKSIAAIVAKEMLREPGIEAEVASRNLLWVLGSVYGQWDIRFATGEKPAPELPDPFAPLPVCPPGMLQNEQGLPAAASDVPASYPLRISWPGILVDDKGNVEDIERRVREALQVIWQDRADAIEQEACEILDVKTLREYFRKPAGFFADHLQRYSKSRRQAPIYWPLSTRSGAYTLWLYYHRLNDQTLYTCVNEFVDKKLKDEITPALEALRAKGSTCSSKEQEEFERLEDFGQELQELRDELLRLAKLPWRPNLNDGVQITAAPLWKLFRLSKWQKTLKETWQTLENPKGEYDWAHLAMTIWPQRVVPKCAKDRSLAIAHEVEDLFWVEDGKGWRALQSPKQETEEQKRRQRSAARDRARRLLAELAQGSDGNFSAADVSTRLAQGKYNDRELALLLYPERMADQCWESPTLAQRLGVKLPAKKTKAAREKFAKEIVAKGCAKIAPMIEAALDGRAKSFAEVWPELEGGNYDELGLALALWPDRVVDKCTEDAALAEQHGLRRFFWVQHPTKAWRSRVGIEEEINNEVARRRGAAAG